MLVAGRTTWRSFCGKRHLRVHEHTRPEQALGIGDRGLHADVAGGLIHHGIHRVDPAFVGVGLALRTYLDRPARLAPGRCLLRQPEVHVDGIEGLQGGHLGSAFQILAEICHADAENAGEGRLDGFLVQFDWASRTLAVA